METIKEILNSNRKPKEKVSASAEIILIKKRTLSDSATNNNWVPALLEQ